ncbi:MAG: ABC transporter permease [Actinomycetia bacterium]|nr:ABC transporter permease [Actinomycetes bacterium]
MALARVLVGKELRSRWRGLVIVGLLAAVWATAAMTAIEGARRTASVVDRFQRVTGASDATFTIEGDDTATELFAALSAAPEVAAVDSLWSAASGLGFDRGLWVGLIVGTEGVWGREFDRPVVVSGRTADPTNAEEVTVTQAMADLFDVEVGDRIALPTWDHDEWEAWHEQRGQYPPFNGPLLDVAVVGIVEIADGLGVAPEDQLIVVATPALFERWGAQIGANNRTIVVTFHDPEFAPSVLAQRLTASLGEPVSSVSDEQAYADNLRDATGALTLGLVVLAIAVLVAGGLVLGLAVTREVRRAGVAYEPLRALGATPWQRIGVLAIPIATVGAAAALVAITAAAFASALFPLGPARVAEPHRGIWLDAPVLAGGVLLVVFMVTTSVLCQLRPHRVVSRASASGGRITVLRNLGPATVVGVANAVGSRRARSTIAVAVVTIAGLTAAAWFERSMDDLGDSPQRWGYTWSSAPEVDVPGSEYYELIGSLAGNTDVSRVSFLDSIAVVVADEPVNLSTTVARHGLLIAPVVLTGRLPVATFEIAVGERTARQLHLEIGDRVRAEAAFAGSSEFTVVGIVVPPYTGTAGDPGVGVYANMVTFDQLNPPPTAIVRNLLIQYAAGVDPQAVEADLSALGFRFEARSHARPPRSIANLVGVTVIVKWLLVFFLIQGLLATMLAAARQGTASARDRQILRTLGFTSRDILRAVSIEAAVVIAIGLGLGLTLGLVAGYQAWELTTGDLGVVDSLSSPSPIVLSVVALALVGAVSVSLTVSRAAAGRGRSFRSLRS